MGCVAMMKSIGLGLNLRGDVCNAADGSGQGGKDRTNNRFWRSRGSEGRWEGRYRVFFDWLAKLNFNHP